MFDVIVQRKIDPNGDEALAINEPLVADWLIDFIKDELVRRRGFTKAVVGLSGGVDSALVAYLCARAIMRSLLLMTLESTCIRSR
jgi:NAD+ synthase